MFLPERIKLTEELLAECQKVALSKGQDYASKEDTLANFKRIAERTGLTPYQVWAIYWNKHVDSVNNAIKASPSFPQTASEPLRGRLVDLINYEILLHCLLTEDYATKCSEVDKKMQAVLLDEANAEANARFDAAQEAAFPLAPRAKDEFIPVHPVQARWLLHNLTNARLGELDLEHGCLASKSELPSAPAPTEKLPVACLGNPIPRPPEGGYEE